MKKRVLSLLLAAGILFGSSAGGHGAVAAAVQPQKQTQSASDETVKAPQYAPDETDAPETTELTDESRTEETTTAPAEEENGAAEIVLRSAFPKDSIFTGQEERYWDTETGFLLPEFYTVKLDGTAEKDAKSTFRVKAVPAKDGKSYTFAAEKAAAVYNKKTYDISFTDTRKITLKDYDPVYNSDHKPSDYKDVTVINEKGTIKLKAEAPFRIAADSKSSSFKGDTVAVSKLTNNAYYLRNNNSSDTVYYLAVSRQYTAQVNVNAALSEYALIDPDLDLSKVKASNKDLSVTVTGYAMTDTAVMELYNDNKLVVSKEVAAKKTDLTTGLSNTFELQHTFSLSELKGWNKVIKLQNLQAKIKAGGTEQTANLKLSDSKKQTADSFILDGALPTVKYSRSGESKKNGWNYAEFIAYDFDDKDSSAPHGSGIKSVEICMDGVHWWTATYEFKEGMESYSFRLNADTVDTNGVIQIEFRITDCAGNTNYVSKDEDGSGFTMDADIIDPVIDSVEVYFKETPESEIWRRFAYNTSQVFGPLPYGTFTQNPVQFRIRAHDPEPDDGGTASGIASVTAGGKECKQELIQKISDFIPDTDVPDDVEVNIIGGVKTELDYYYYEIEEGLYSDFKIVVKDQGGNTAELSLIDILDDGFGIDVTESNDLYYDTGAPDLTAEAKNFVKATLRGKDGDEDVFDYWYSKDVVKSMDRKIEVSYGDSFGIIAVDVEIDGQRSTDYSKLYRNEKELTKKASFDIPISAIHEEGSHTVRIIAKDNAGNVKEKVIYLRLDYTEPKLSEFVISSGEGMPEGWCRSDGLPVVTVRFEDENPEKAVLTVNGQNKTYTADSGEWTKNGDGTVTVTLDLAADMDDNQNKFIFDEDQVFRIGGTLTDGVGNTLDLADQTIHVDKDAPTLNSVFVGRTETAPEKLLRVLTFGIFSNEKFKYSVDVSDGKDPSYREQRESGVASVEIRLSPEGEFCPMTYESDIGFYTYVIPKGDPDYQLVAQESYQGTVVFRVTDKVGRQTTAFGQDPDPADGEYEIRLGTDNSVRTKSNAYMLENIAPEITVEMPKADSADRTAEKWYSLTDADSKIIKVSASDQQSGLYEVTATLTVRKRHGFGTEEQSRDYVILSPDGLQNLDMETFDLTEIASSEAEFDLLTLFRDLTPDLDGRCEFTVTASDLAGNRFTTKTEVYYIDWKTPEVHSIDLTPVSADRYANTADYPGSEQFVDVLEYGFYFKEPFTATVNVSDEGPSSGMDRITYRLVEYRNNALYKSGEAQSASVGADGKASFRIPADFKGQIFVSVYDNVGNTPETEVTPHSFVVDTPERHASEEHISVTGFTGTNYKDSEQNPLYTGNVTLTVKITDSVSGIRSIAYAMNSERNRQEERTIEIPNTGCRVGQALGDGWSVAKTDENLVTEVERVYSFTGDDNGIGLSFRMTDRSGNSSEKKPEVFSIDQTAPVIQAEFHSAAGNGAYYSQKRTATITVTERNFDPARIRTEITNRIGGTPSVSFRDESDTVHVAELEFDEGDYTFSVSGTDLCDHTAGVSYSGGHENEFYVDLRDPVVVTNFSELTNGSKNSFRGDQKVTFSITEHNFVKDSVRITVERAPSGKELNSTNREDCTNEFVTRDMWTDSGDVHTAGFTFSKDAVYRVTISATDAAGRSAASAVSPIFEVDKKKPVLNQPANLSRIVYTKKNPQTEADPIVFADENIDHISYSVVSYRLKRDADQVGYGMEVSESETMEVKSNSVVLSDEYFSRDGIYEVKCVAYDVAGNQSDSTTHTFVVQRDSDFLVYIPDSSKEEKTGLYKFNQIGIRSADFEDIRVIAYVTSDREFGIQVDGEDVTGEDITVSEITGSALGGGKQAGETINQVTAYDLTLKNSYIAQKYGDETIDTDLLLNAVAASSDDVQKITLGHIYIDNVKPVGEYESALQDLGFFGGFYGMDSRAVKIEGVSPDIDITRSEIQLNDAVLKAEDGGFVYDEDAHTIGFTLGKGYTDIKTTLVDNAGNTYVLPIVKKVYVGGLFARFWYLFILGGLALIAVPALAVVSFLRKKRSGAAF